MERGQQNRAGLRSLGDQLIDSRTFRDQGQQRFSTLDDDSAAALLDQRGEADELERVAQPLFRMQQDGSPFQRRAVPPRLGERAAGKYLTFPAPFMLLPALFKVARQQPGLSPVVVGLGIIGLEFQSSIVTGKRFLEMSEFPLNDPQAVQGIHEVGLESQRFLQTGSGLFQPPQACQRITQIEVRFSIVGLEANGMLQWLDCLGIHLMLAEDESKIVVSLGIVGLELDGTPEAPDGFFLEALAMIGVAQVEV